MKDIKRIIAPAYNPWDDKQFNYYIEKFELPLNKAIKTFSKGMKMKASLSLALSYHPELIIVDEPTAGSIFSRRKTGIIELICSSLISYW